MNNKNDFLGCSWIGVPSCLYLGRPWTGRLTTQIAYFRKEFFLSDIGTLTMHISASTRYRLYVNGVSILSGPCKGDKWRHYYETIDVSKHLHRGKNLIAVKVVAYPPYEAQSHDGNGQGPEFTVNSAAGPVLAVSGVVLDRYSEKQACINTGETTWSVSLDSAVEWKTPRLTFWMGGMEIVNGNLLPTGWNDSFSPAGEWAQADVRWAIQKSRTGGILPFPLMKRPIPLLYEKRVEFTREMPLKDDGFTGFSFSDGPAVIPANTCAAVELDAGVLNTAYVLLKIKGGRGSKIIIKYAESYANKEESTNDMPEGMREYVTDSIILKKGKRDDSLNYGFIGHQDEYLPSGGNDAYQPFWFRTFRFMRIEVYAGGEEIIIQKPVITETGYPLEAVSEFTSSDKMFEKIWEISLNTLRRCMHETHEDCPYYEQMQYTMDTRLQMLFTYALSGDTRMALRTIDDYHASLLPEGILQSRYPVQATQVIPMFALHFIFMLEDYFIETGDISVPRRYRPTVDAVLDWYERYTDETGLVGFMDYWQFTDWVEAWNNNEGTSNASLVGASTVNNLKYAYAMRTAARLNRLTGRIDTADEYEAKANKILQLVETLCWDNEKGLYMEGPYFKEYGQHAQVFAVLTGLKTGDDAKELMRKTLEQQDLLKCSFPWMFYFIRALEEAGMYEETAAFYDVFKEFISLNVTTVPETPFEPRSECHAWGSFPLYEFTRSLLGVRPGAPGWEYILIRPLVTAVSDCGGTVHTPKGNVKLNWVKSGGMFKLYGHAPKGVKTVVVLPDGRREELTNGGGFEFASAL